MFKANRRNLMSYLHPKPKQPKVVHQFRHAEEALYKRDLTVGGAILFGWGTKYILLPGISVSNPFFLILTVSVTTITSQKYLRNVWHTISQRRKPTSDTFVGLATVLTVATGGVVTALSAVWLLNLGQYIKIHDQRLTNKSIQSKDHISDKDTLQATRLIWEPWFIEQRQHLVKYVIPILVWMIFLYAFWPLLSIYYLIFLQYAYRVEQFLRISPYGPWVFVSIFALGPLFLLPATLLNILGGYFFGPVWGSVYSLIGSNIAGTVTYIVGRYFGQTNIDNHANRGTLQHYIDWMHQNPFKAVLTMHIIWIPFEIVNYLAGFLQLNWAAFALGTALGSFFPTISFALFGASVEGSLIKETPTLNWTTLAAGGLILVGSFTLAQYFKSREAKARNLIKHLNSPQGVENKFGTTKAKTFTVAANPLDSAHPLDSTALG